MREKSDSLSPFLSQPRPKDGVVLKIDKSFSLTPMSAEAKAEKQDKQLRDAAKMYENHFLGEMVKAMKSTVGQEDGLIKRNSAEKIFQEQLDQQYVDGWSDKGGVGLADMIYSQIKEKYFGSAPDGKAGGALRLKGALPIGPGKEAKGMKPIDNIQMKMLPPSAGNSLKYRFQGGSEVMAPMAGKISALTDLGQGWNSIGLDHGGGMRSELTFPGQNTALALGSDVEPGQRLGVLDPSQRALAWNLDWS